jgi:hypothetical protein
MMTIGDVRKLAALSAKISPAVVARDDRRTFLLGGQMARGFRRIKRGPG